MKKYIIIIAATLLPLSSQAQVNPQIQEQIEIYMRNQQIQDEYWNARGRYRDQYNVYRRVEPNRNTRDKNIRTLETLSDMLNN